MFVPQIVGGDAVPVPPLLILNVSVLKWKIFSSLGCYQCLIIKSIFNVTLHFVLELQYFYLQALRLVGELFSAIIIDNPMQGFSNSCCCCGWPGYNEVTEIQSHLKINIQWLRLSKGFHWILIADYTTAFLKYYMEKFYIPDKFLLVIFPARHM